MAEEIKQAIPSPEDRVRAMTAEELLTDLLVGFVRSEGRPFTDEYNCVRAELLSRLSLIEELIPFCDSPCGHTSQYAYSEDGGKNIVCLICEREELKGQVAAKEPTPEQIKAIKVSIIKKWQSWIGPLGNPDHYKIQAKMLELEVARETAEAEVALLRKRKDYHAEYVEAVEAAEKAERALRQLVTDKEPNRWPNGILPAANRK